MNQTLVGNINNQNVYLINDEKVPYYISVPNEKTATIVINLPDNPDKINTAKNSLTEIPNIIKEMYSKLSREGSAIITPVIDSKIMEQVKLNTDPKCVSFLNQAIGYIINKAYSTLKQNGKEIFKNIKLNDNVTYKIFNNRFQSLYNDRIELVKYDNNVTNINTPQTNIPNIQNIQNEEPTIANTTTIPLDDAYKELEVENPKVKTRTKEPGFVSYVLLGVIVAVLSLIGLYLLL